MTECSVFAYCSLRFCRRAGQEGGRVQGTCPDREEKHVVEKHEGIHHPISLPPADLYCPNSGVCYWTDVGDCGCAGADSDGGCCWNHRLPSPEAQGTCQLSPRIVR
jgi:hypothetical protein